MSFRQSRGLSFSKARDLVRAAKIHGVRISPSMDGVLTVSGALANKGYGEDILVAVRQVSPGSRWGDEGIAAMIEQQTQSFRVNKSGVSRQDLATLRKALSEEGI